MTVEVDAAAAVEGYAELPFIIGEAERSCRWSSGSSAEKGRPDDGSSGRPNWLPCPDRPRTIAPLVMELKVPWAAGAMGWGRSNQRKIRSVLVRERGWPNPVHRARIYEEALERLGSYGRVGKEFGVTRIDVCHYVTLVRRLPPEVVTFVEQLGDPMQDRRYTLRALLKMARLTTANEQRAAFRPS